MLKKLIDQLEKEMGLNTYLQSPEIPDTYILPFDEETEVKISQTPEGILFKSKLGPPPSKNLEEFYARALEGNLFHVGTFGATLGVDGSGKQLTLSRLIDYNIEYEQFKEILEDFLNGVEVWLSEANEITE